MWCCGVRRDQLCDDHRYDLGHVGADICGVSSAARMVMDVVLLLWFRHPGNSCRVLEVRHGQQGQLEGLHGRGQRCPVGTEGGRVGLLVLRVETEPVLAPRCRSPDAGFPGRVPKRWSAESAILLKRPGLAYRKAVDAAYGPFKGDSAHGLGKMGSGVVGFPDPYRLRRR